MMNGYGKAKELAQTVVDSGKETYTVFRLHALQEAGLGSVDALPYTLRVWLENLVHHQDREEVTDHDDSTCRS